MGALGCDNGWIQITDAVRPRVLLVAPRESDFAYAMEVARHMGRRARVEVVTTDPQRRHPQVASMLGITIHRFQWRVGLATWAYLYAPRFEIVHLPQSVGSFQPEAVALRKVDNLVRESTDDLSAKDLALRLTVASVASAQARPEPEPEPLAA